jgi:vacuolar-type H+-ATPase subunit H
LNEKRIQQVLEIEKQANAIREAMIHEASQLPGQAEKEAQALIDKSRADAEREARDLIAKAQSETDSNTILSEVREKISRTESLAQGNINQAVAYVISRVIGRG